MALGAHGEATVGAQEDARAHQHRPKTARPERPASQRDDEDVLDLSVSEVPVHSPVLSDASVQGPSGRLPRLPSRRADEPVCGWPRGTPARDVSPTRFGGPGQRLSQTSLSCGGSHGHPHRWRWSNPALVGKLFAESGRDPSSNVLTHVSQPNTCQIQSLIPLASRGSNNSLMS